MEVWLVQCGYEYDGSLQGVEVFASREAAESRRLELLKEDEEGIAFDWAFVQRRIVES